MQSHGNKLEKAFAFVDKKDVILFGCFLTVIIINFLLFSLYFKFGTDNTFS